MSIRKIMLFVLVIVAVISVAINALVLTSLTDRYFKSYLSENYEGHIQQIKEYTQNAIESDSVSYNQMALELETHLDDPIIRIKLYDKAGDLLVDVQKTDIDGDSKRYRGMMGNMMDKSTEEVEQFKITSNGNLLGYINITRNSTAENSVVAKLFKASLIRNSAFSTGIALAFAIVLGFFVSRKMSRALKDTAEYANDLQVGESRQYTKSGIIEIKQIRERLFELGTRLKLKQKSRKKLLDQMIHQTRTPLTIMKTHLEGIEDGVIDTNQVTLAILLNQIESLTSIISNMSGMIDTESEFDELNIVSFDLNVMIEQIVQGLLASFQKKKISIQLTGKLNKGCETDQFRLSQALYNVLTNAYKYTLEDGHVNVDISFDKLLNNVVITVTDDGIGIDDETKEHIFDAYFRGITETSSSGDGLGLYVANENMQRIGGKIECVSEKGTGSQFILTFPAKYIE